MKIRLFLFVWLLGLAFSQEACTQGNETPLISGTITLHPDWRPQLYLVRPDYYKQLISSYEGVVLDSTQIKPDGSFVFYKKDWLKEPGLYMLFIQPKNRYYTNEIATPAPAENYICLVLSPDEPIQLIAEASQLSRSYKLNKANAESFMLAQLRNSREVLYREFDSLKVSNAHEDPEAWATHGSEGVQKSMHAAIDAFLDSTSAVLPTFAALRLRTPDNEFRDRPEFFLRVKERLHKSSPDHPWLAELDYFMHPSRLPVLVGEKMPDFALPDPKGDTLKLSDVLSPLVLVDFWASWCAPCRRETKEVIRPLYDQYHARGFNVLGVSIDAGKESWVNAIQRDGAIWYQTCDLMGDASPVRSDLKFEYIPANYLLDGSGKLLARNLHGAELKAFVADFFGQ